MLFPIGIKILTICLIINSSEKSLNTFQELIAKNNYISNCKFESKKLQITEGKKYFSVNPNKISV